MKVLDENMVGGDSGVKAVGLSAEEAARKAQEEADLQAVADALQADGAGYSSSVTNGSPVVGVVGIVDTVTAAAKAFENAEKKAEAGLEGGEIIIEDEANGPVSKNGLPVGYINSGYSSLTSEAGRVLDNVSGALWGSDKLDTMSQAFEAAAMRVENPENDAAVNPVDPKAFAEALNGMASEINNGSMSLEVGLMDEGIGGQSDAAAMMHALSESVKMDPSGTAAGLKQFYEESDRLLKEAYGIEDGMTGPDGEPLVNPEYEAAKESLTTVYGSMLESTYDAARTMDGMHDLSMDDRMALNEAADVPGIKAGFYEYVPGMDVRSGEPRVDLVEDDFKVYPGGSATFDESAGSYIVDKEHGGRQDGLLDKMKEIEVPSKYEMTENTMTTEDGKTLYQIRATQDIQLADGTTVKAGDLGGWIEKPENLSQAGNAWVGGGARVYGDAQVSEDALVTGMAEVKDNGVVKGDAVVGKDMTASKNDNPFLKLMQQDSTQKLNIEAPVISGNATVEGDANVYGRAKVGDYAEVSGGRIYGKAEVDGNAHVLGDARVLGNAHVTGESFVMGDATVKGNARVDENAVVKGNAQIKDDAVVAGMATVRGDAVVSEEATVRGEAIVKGESQLSGKSVVEGTTELDGKITLTGNQRLDHGTYKSDLIADINANTQSFLDKGKSFFAEVGSSLSEGFKSVADAGKKAMEEQQAQQEAAQVRTGRAVPSAFEDIAKAAGQAAEKSVDGMETP